MTTCRNVMTSIDGMQPPLVLLVDDYPDAREMVGVGLELDGFRVTFAGDALEAIKAARSHRPDVILMDACLPGMSGWDAVQMLKRDPLLSAIPTLMLTGHVLSGSRQRATAAGADGFIEKPCSPETLTREVLAALANVGDPRVTGLPL